MSKKKKPTKAESDYMSKVAALNCLICGRPAEVHHVKLGGGANYRNHYLTVPLCEKCHRLGGYGEAVHAGQRQFETINSTSERDMLAETIKRMQK